MYVFYFRGFFVFNPELERLRLVVFELELRLVVFELELELERRDFSALFLELFLEFFLEFFRLGNKRCRPLLKKSYWSPRIFLHILISGFSLHSLQARCSFVVEFVYFRIIWSRIGPQSLSGNETNHVAS